MPTSAKQIKHMLNKQAESEKKETPKFENYVHNKLTDEERKEAIRLREEKKELRRQEREKQLAAHTKELETYAKTGINGFKLKEVEWCIPPKKERKSKRNAFDRAREKFLMHVGETMEPQLRDLGMNEEQIKMVKAGQAPTGYNVHHKLPIHGGGTNDFKNLILMPVKPHDELHHNVIDPQILDLKEGQKKKVLIPWTDDMVYVPPEKKKAREQQAAKQKGTKTSASVFKKLLQRSGR